MPDWNQDELDAHAAWLDQEMAEENFLATGIPSQDEVESMLERQAFA